MRLKTAVVIAALVFVTGLGLENARAGDLKITLPRHSKLTPVQRLNREGVEEIDRHHYEKAEGLFYKAYLFDPADPFTLNNLGFISELQGKLNRAETFYKLAGEQGSNAYIAMSSSKDLKGKPMIYALSDLKDLPMRINRMNVDAMELLAQNRNAEADLLLRHALSLDPRNVFTLNNMGVALEAGGEFEEALSYYDEAAAEHSSEPIVVTLNSDWRGKPVSRMAAESARALRSRMKELVTAQARAAVFNRRGVTEANENNWEAARKDFLRAYSLDPYSAFSLNNAGYVAQRDGDLETAQFFYARARQANNANARVGLATEHAAEGNHLLVVASGNNDNVQQQIEVNSAARRQEKGPIELLHRNGSPVTESKPPAQNPAPAAQPAPNSPSSGSQPPQ